MNLMVSVGLRSGLGATQSSHQLDLTKYFVLSVWKRQMSNRARAEICARDKCGAAARSQLMMADGCTRFSRSMSGSGFR